MSLTGRSYFLIVVILLVGIIGQWADPALRDIWRYLSSATLLILVYEGWRTFQHPFTLELVVDEVSHLGRSLTGDMQLNNPGAQTITVMVQAGYSDVMLIDRAVYTMQALPGDATVQPFSVIPQSLGVHQWAPIYTRSKGALGLAWWDRKFLPAQTLRVTPDRMYEHEYRTATQPQGEINKKVLGSGMELLGLRDYVPGDPLHAIDWKATARSNKPITRLFSEEQHLEMVLMIDCGYTSGLQAGAITRVNHYINIASRLAQKAILNGDRVGVITYADTVLQSLPPVGGAAGIRKVRDMLEETHTIARESNLLTAVMNLRRRLQQRSLVVMFCDTDESETGSQLLRSVRLLRPKYLPLFVSLIDEDVDAMKEGQSDNWLDPYYAFAAMEVTLSSRRLALRLQRLGCHLVHQKARHLDKAVLNYYGDLRALV